MFESINFNDFNNSFLIPWGIKILYSLLIIVFGFIIKNIVVKLMRGVLTRAKLDNILVNFISSITNAVLLIFIIIAAIDQLGVETTSLIAVLGAAGLAIGLALQGSLQNFAAGVMLIIFRPFKDGDYVEAAGIEGSVQNISIFNTILKTVDNREIIIPNGSVYGGTIINFSSQETRRIDMVFGIGYGDDLKKAKEIISAVINSDDRILNEPATKIAVAELADSSVNFVVRPWVKTADYWSVRFDLIEKIKLAFDENNISIPFPQMDVHIEKVDS